ncbi:hypothetical protein GCM10012286_13850 [Streptomyces lasiicapitis]|uniref:Uncharacterized protein n=1 Tax=Streptomyces lasiicapitis TaxID=1923961 RepID=A0ABQ2LKG8_9ACTN|nr:hypothetical protein GCM10012286_13850 [Streptomyces lasiicapitis]
MSHWGLLRGLGVAWEGRGPSGGGPSGACGLDPGSDFGASGLRGFGASLEGLVSGQVCGLVSGSGPAPRLPEGCRISGSQLGVWAGWRRAGSGREIKRRAWRPGTGSRGLRTGTRGPGTQDSKIRAPKAES